MNLPTSILRFLAIASFTLCARVPVVSAEPRIAFSKDGAIHTASLNGREIKKICRGADPCISNDGRFLVYTHTDETAAKAKKSGSGEAPFTRSLRLRELAAGGKEITLPAGGATQVYGALWSPDDAWIAFNVLVAKGWQVAVVRPDGSDFRVLTEKLDFRGMGVYLAGWNYHRNEVLAHNLATMVQLNPASGALTWEHTLKEVTGEEAPSSNLRCTISPDGVWVVTSRQIAEDEFKNLDGPSYYLALVRFPNGEAWRVTPTKFCATNPWLDPGGTFVLFRGFAKDVTPIKGSDGLHIKERIYRFDIESGKMIALIEGGDCPSASR